MSEPESPTNKLTELERENRRLREELEGMKRTFDLRWKADRRATRRWQEANPGNDLVWPDHADMVVFLLGELDRARTSNSACSEHACHELIEVDEQGVTRLPDAMVSELGNRIWFLRAEEHWEAWSEDELNESLLNECGDGAGPSDAGDGCICGEINARNCPVHQL